MTGATIPLFHDDPDVMRQDALCENHGHDTGISASLDTRLRAYASNKLVILGFILFFLWLLPLTKAVLAFQSQRVVTISVKSIIQSKVRMIAKEDVSPEAAGVELKTYLLALQSAIATYARTHHVAIEVSESVLASDYEDVSPKIMALMDAPARPSKGS